jgi:hypothetical protein
MVGQCAVLWRDSGWCYAVVITRGLHMQSTLMQCNLNGNAQVVWCARRPVNGAMEALEVEDTSAVF